MLWLAVAALAVTPVRGRSATAWLLAALAHAAGSLAGWTRFTSHAARGAVLEVGTVDLPGSCPSFRSTTDRRPGRPSGAPRSSRTTPAAPGRSPAQQYPGIGMSSPEQRDRYGDGLSGLSRRPPA